MFNRLTRLKHLMHWRYALPCIATILIAAGLIGLIASAASRSAESTSFDVYAVDSAQMSQESLTDYVETQVRPLISALPGVSKFTRIGGTPIQSAFLDGRRVVGFEADSSGDAADVFAAIAGVLTQLHDENQKMVFTALSRPAETHIGSGMPYKALLLLMAAARDQTPILIRFKLPPDSTIDFGEQQAEAARKRITDIRGVERVFACVGRQCPSHSSADAASSGTLLITVATGIDRSRNEIHTSVHTALASLDGIGLGADD